MKGAAEDRLQSFLARRRGSGALDDVQALSGDASTRRYFRVSWEAKSSAVVAVYPEPFAADAHPFLEVHNLLAGWGIPVPQLLAVDGDCGLVVLEDLGDTTLQEHLRSAAPAERQRLYVAALDMLRQLQVAAAAQPSAAGCYGLVFDREKLVWELELFVEHFIEGHRGRVVPQVERAALTVCFERVCEEIASWPRVLCHRDFHSRNLMWHRGRLVWIDYQDARMGPVTYDLASLLCDAYVDVPDALLEERIEGFRRDATPCETPEEFRGRFDLTAAQRTLKALGTFGYQAVVRGNPTYLEYVPRTLGVARRSLARHPALGELHSLLARHIEELRA